MHATIAGILLAFTIPARTFLEKPKFVAQSRRLLDRLEAAPRHSFEEHSLLVTLEQKAELADSPLHRIELGLQPWISFLVMPLFALANVGVDQKHGLAGALTHSASLGIVLGLVVGKPAGIWLASILAAKTRIALAPQNVTWRQIFGVAWLCGIGFTMSLFVADLAFDDSSLLNISKVAILGASVLSGVFGCLTLSKLGSTRTEQSLHP